MNGTEYVIEQLGQALKNSHEALARQTQRIQELEAALAAASEPADR